jgi:hypothetical protein
MLPFQEHTYLVARGLQPEEGQQQNMCLPDSEIWTTHGGVNPCGLIVRQGEV